MTLITFFFFFLAAPHGMFPNQGSNPCPLCAVEAQSVNHWAPREIPNYKYLLFFHLSHSPKDLPLPSDFLFL